MKALMTQIFHNRKNGILTWLLSVVTLCILWLVSFNSLAISYPNPVGTLLKCLGDASIILSPFLLVGNKWKKYIVVPIWIFGIWCLINIIYFRFWHDLLPVSAFVMTGNVNNDLLGYTASLLKPLDSLFILLPFLLTIAVGRLRPGKCPSMSVRQRLVCFFMAGMIGLIGQISYLKTHLSWRYADEDINLKEKIKQHYAGPYESQRNILENDGVGVYFIRYIADAVGLTASRIDLTDDDKNEILAFLNHHTLDGSSSRLDSVNLVYIIVESLNSDVIGMEIEEKKIMPTLDSLSKADGSIFFPRVVPQIKDGSSSDGHLILLTGLLPIAKGPYSMLFGSSDTFPSIAEKLPLHHKYLLMADEGQFWNEKQTLENFGLGKAVTITDMDFDSTLHGKDGAMLMQASAMLDTVRRPFLMTLMTMSMHMPFDEKAWKIPPFISNAPAMNDIQKKYLNVCHGMDSYLKRMIEKLPPNTIVIIASDHTQRMAIFEEKTPFGVFIAINTGRTYRTDRIVGQVNIYPALLEILGICGGYCGMAPSAMDESIKGSVDSYGNKYGFVDSDSYDDLNKAFRLSDKMIRGDYFHENR